MSFDEEHIDEKEWWNGQMLMELNETKAKLTAAQAEIEKMKAVLVEIRDITCMDCVANLMAGEALATIGGKEKT